MLIISTISWWAEKVTWRVLAQLLMHHFNGHFSKQRGRLLWERCTVLLKKREVAGSKCLRTWGGGGPGAVMKETKRNASANESSASPIVIYELYHSFSQFSPVLHSCCSSQSVHCINHWHIHKQIQFRYMFLLATMDASTDHMSPHQ